MPYTVSTHLHQKRSPPQGWPPASWRARSYQTSSAQQSTLQPMMKSSPCHCTTLHSSPPGSGSIPPLHLLSLPHTTLIETTPSLSLSLPLSQHYHCHYQCHTHCHNIITITNCPHWEKYTWKTVTRDQSKESKFFLSDLHLTVALFTSAQVHGRPSGCSHSLPPNRCMPRILQIHTSSVICNIGWLITPSFY